jgi:hypothetical protein
MSRRAAIVLIITALSLIPRIERNFINQVRNHHRLKGDLVKILS